MFPPAAGNAFCKAARLQLRVDGKLNAAVNFIDAGNAFKKSDPEGKLPQSPLLPALCKLNMKC